HRTLRTEQVRPLGPVVVRAQLEADGNAERVDPSRGLVPRLVVARLPEPGLLRKVALLVGGDCLATPVEDERAARPPTGPLLSVDDAADEADARLGGRLDLDRRARPAHRLGILIARLPG